MFAGCDARRIRISADEFNRESSRMILICRDLHSNVLGYLPLQVMPHRVEKRAMVLFFAPFFHHFNSFFFDQNAEMTFLIKKCLFDREKGQIMTFLTFLTFFFII